MSAQAMLTFYTTWSVIVAITAVVWFLRQAVHNWPFWRRKIEYQREAPGRFVEHLAHRYPRRLCNCGRE